MAIPLVLVVHGTAWGQQAPAPVLPALSDESLPTGYVTQRRADITGAVATVNLQDVRRQTGANVLKTLAGAGTGVTVDASGSPGSRTTVRVRGVTSFQNNDPLYVIDGTPVQTSNLSWLSSDDIASIQVLKDAAAAAIYGARASNGVVIIETRRGGPRAGRPRATLDIRTGIAAPVNGYSTVLVTNPLDYFQFVKRSYLNAGLSVPTNIYGNDSRGNNPSVPTYIWPNNCSPNPCTTVDTSAYSYPDSLIVPGSPGTDWWGAVFHPAFVGTYNLSVAGGGEADAYHLSFNYLDQRGTVRYNHLQRGSLRSNTALTLGPVRLGENLALSRVTSHGGIDDANLGANSLIGKNIFEQPVVPIYDIHGNFASGKAPGLGNLSNPFKLAYEGLNDVSTSDLVFGNAFGEMHATSGLTLRSALGLDLGRESFTGYTPAYPENAEPSFIDGINENHRRTTEWTWSNTLTYQASWGRHRVNLLVGQELNHDVSRFAAASCGNPTGTPPPGTGCDPSLSSVDSSAWNTTLLSFFGTADYNFADRYLLSVTLRRDGSSSLGPGRTWGTFPAVGLGWLLTNEPFLRPGRVISGLKLRLDWGITGNQGIAPGRIASQLGDGGSFYDTAGSLTTMQPGYVPIAAQDSGLKWEEDKSANVGLDMGLFRGRATISVDLYQRNTRNILYDPRTPGTAGTGAAPLVNVGKMKNRGIEVSLALQGGGKTQWSITFNGSHYTNRIVQIDEQGDSSFFGPSAPPGGTPVINKVGYPIGAFYGYLADGYYLDSADAAPYWTSGARPGRIKLKDLNGDGIINALDRTVIGSPDPDFTTGLDLSLRRGSWDVSATLFGSFGNQIFNYQRYWDVFAYFNTNVRKDRLTSSVVLVNPDGSTCTGPCSEATVSNPNAKYPRMDQSDLFSELFSSYWVESGSYVRLRAIRLGYNLPPDLIRWLAVARVYLKAENLFTLTGYSGLDPALPAAAFTGAAGDISDQFRGIDQGAYPSSRTFSVGIGTSF